MGLGVTVRLLSAYCRSADTSTHDTKMFVADHLVFRQLQQIPSTSDRIPGTAPTTPRAPTQTTPRSPGSLLTRRARLWGALPLWRPTRSGTHHTIRLWGEWLSTISGRAMSVGYVWYVKPSGCNNNGSIYPSALVMYLSAGAPQMTVDGKGRPRHTFRIHV